jgi:hypothetical protein
MIIGSGVLATEVRPVGGFTAISVSVPGRLFVEHTGSESLVVTAEDNVLPLLRTEARGGRLDLSLAANSSLTPMREIVFRVSVRELEEVEGSGAARVELRGVQAERLAVRLSGASTVTATGQCGQLDLQLSGASRAEAEGLTCMRVIADLSGASYGRVRAHEALVANLSGASLLEYLGDPRLQSSLSGGSVVRRTGP